jgi:hypothetical protein
MSDDYQRIELITGTARRRRWTTEQKLRIIEASYEPGESVSSVARRHGVAPNDLERRVLISGGAGFLGSHLADRLLERLRWRGSSCGSGPRDRHNVQSTSVRTT